MPRGMRLDEFRPEATGRFHHHGRAALCIANIIAGKSQEKSPPVSTGSFEEQGNCPGGRKKRGMIIPLFSIYCSW
jgi:hypothetical protein